MKLVRSAVLVLALGLCTTASAYSEPEREAERLLGLMKMEQTLHDAMSQMLDLQLKQNPALVPYRPVIMRFLEKHMSYQNLKDDMIQIYENAFTTAELRELNIFYASPVGRKVVDKLPELMKQGAQLGAARVQANLPELQAMIQAEVERLEGRQQ